MAAVAAHAPHLLPTQRPSVARARVSGRGWAPLASLGLAAVWVGLAVWHPTTTYHLGPVLTAAAWPRLARGLAGKPLQPVAAVVATAGGTTAALGALVLLAALHALQGPTLLGGGGPIAEALALVAVGSDYGLWAASRPARRSDGSPPAN